MPEMAMLNQAVQIGVESTAGTAVAANKKLQALMIDTAIKSSLNRYRPAGGKFGTITTLGKEWVEAKLSGPMTYTEMSYLASGNIAYAAPAQQSSTIAYLWTHTPGQSAADTIKTFTVERGSADRAHRAAYGLVNSLGYTIDRNGCNWKGSLLMSEMEDDVTLTSSPTSIALVPVLPTQVCVYADPASGDLGTTKLTRVFSLDWEFSDRYGAVWPLDCALTGFAAHVETEPKATLKMLMAADDAGMGYLANMRVGDKTFLRIQATGGEIVSGQDYQWTHDICGVVSSEPGEFKDQDGIYAIEWTFEATYDATWAKAFTWSEKNTLTAL